MTTKSWLSSVFFAFGLLVTWVGERIVDAGTPRLVATGLGLALVLLGLGLRALRLSRATTADRATVERGLLVLQVLGLAAVLVYFMTSDVFTKVAGTSLETASPVLAKALGALWPAVVIAALLPLLFVELAYAAMVKAPVLEAARIAEARNAGLGFAFALTFAFSLQYVVTERDVKADFSYFRMARPGEATKKQAAALDAKVEVALFFPPGSDVAELAQAYFDELKADAPLLAVARYDQALEPVKAKELGVSSNGAVVFKKGERKETLYLGTELEKARTALRGLDADVQKKLLQVAKSRRTVYLTQGHGERTRDPLGSDPRATVDAVYRELQGQNFEVRTLTAADGLANEVPSDAAAVFIVGPKEPFAAPEAEALEAYDKRGGRLFIALDPENGSSYDELLKPLGLSFTPTQLADEKFYVRTSAAQSPSDRYNIATKTFSSHPSVNYLSRANGLFITLGVGAVDELPAHAAELTVDFAARSGAGAFNDLNHNFAPDVPPEVKKSYGLVAAVTRRAPSSKKEDELRAIVVGDSDFMADAIIAQAQGNGLFLLDALKWMLGEDNLTGTTNSELDVPLSARSRQQDAVWFYGTTFLAPLAVAGLGLLARRRTGKARPSKKAQPVEAKS